MAIVAVKFHWWKGFGPERDLFFLWFRVGLLSLGVCFGALTDKIRKLTDACKVIGGQE